MTTSARRTTPAKGPATVKRVAAKARAGEPKLRPFLRFHHSQDLRDKTLRLLDAVDGARDATIFSLQITELVLELTESGMDQYFLHPLKTTKANFVVQQSAALGLAGVQKVMGTVIRNMIGRMDGRQLVSVSASIRQFMV
jgi:hypothetical protein